MAVKIRLKRLGKIRSPYYRIVVADARTKRDGRVIEEIGKYDPTQHPSFIEVNGERAQYWLGVGAQPTEQVAAILKLSGDWAAFTGEGDTSSKILAPEPKPIFEADAAKKPVLRPKAEKPAEAPVEAAAEAEEAAEAPAEEAAEAAEAPEAAAENAEG
ncbi:MAG: 30S ribosomal protein S16 [Leucobacter sp.]|nr:30S ribosomal protein S16 [Leucobacter sp.]